MFRLSSERRSLPGSYLEHLDQNRERNAKILKPVKEELFISDGIISLLQLKDTDRWTGRRMDRQTGGQTAGVWT